MPASVTVTQGPVGPIISGYQKTKCVDDNNDSSANDTEIVISECTDGAGQEWAIEEDGTIQLNGKCMGIYRDEQTNKAPVQLWTCTGGANQRWQAVNGTLVNPISGKCLDDLGFNTTNGTQLEIYTCSGGANEQWVLPGGTPPAAGRPRTRTSRLQFSGTICGTRRHNESLLHVPERVRVRAC